ncbi:hypothetical protein BDDG_11965 [Blastomyces dermatitidis ATCC 18188]|uniref:Uncharacterized protein n=1 Tax=Ajellomyces dermatitidis (strain ATCC 18188 / CBS 674.68) TaxID=653446 RepID=A0A0J9EPP7_AJEDA|nr:hypothetical protein BDDG_11965 [Blastomyces dermatitidis ATCC 18188]
MVADGRMQKGSGCIGSGVLGGWMYDMPGKSLQVSQISLLHRASVNPQISQSLWWALEQGQTRAKKDTQCYSFETYPQARVGSSIETFSRTGSADGRLCLGGVWESDSLLPKDPKTHYIDKIPVLIADWIELGSTLIPGFLEEDANLTAR